MREINGEFEIHLTVREHRAGALATFAEHHDLRYTEIELDRGRHVAQPMLNLRCGGTLRDAVATADHWHDELRRAGLEPCRTKVEAAPWNEGVPQSDAAATGDPQQRYFEHHVKLLLPDAAPERLAALTELLTPYGARLSRNARRVRGDGREERFATQRCHRVGYDTAKQRLDALLAALAAARHEVLEVEREYVVRDDAVSLDAGWLEPTATPGGMP